MRTEEELAGALRAAGERAPDEGDLLAGLALRRRRRTRRRLRMLAAATAVVLLGVGIGGLVRSGEGEVATPPAPAPRTAPAKRLWPGAVFTMRTVGPGEVLRHPITGVSPTEVLVLTQVKETRRRLEVYDTAAGQFRQIAELGSVRKYNTPIVAADGVNVAWYTTGEIWTAPLAGGGKARLVTTLPAGRSSVDAISINGDRIVWSERRGDVWRISLTGGGPERIPAGKGLRLLRWPWASDVPDNHDNNQRIVVDLTIGTRQEVSPRPRSTSLRCGPHWCYGRDSRGDGFLQRIDGSQLRRVGAGFDHLQPWSLAPVLNRFVLLKSGVYDIQTGSTATVGNVQFGLPGSGEPSTIFYWPVTRGTIEVLNLAAVPTAQ
ncbi:hypothetical protein AB0I81_10140 [Nonomuraea sp. NPDC050404]|uniref:TolB family protein n=1 Tax=Nonomuraea sp. NPDC050404 TaxID=3155783 RepID=UPI0033D2BA06